MCKLKPSRKNEESKSTKLSGRNSKTEVNIDAAIKSDSSFREKTSEATSLFKWRLKKNPKTKVNIDAATKSDSSLLKKTSKATESTLRQPLLKTSSINENVK
ncbi:uncharacterized protein PHALS_01232 [Plasmopara halstedii]|uniref:Uncharacterized protein n=1 Tax=Plasmopara halstedii TaxID=4781 RepID=A0A0P1ATR1_PLAHL|nr:uncharacterized protein PHALS_01232 [Plasmopara halstedii]CEG44905.1 hypothetical protein PHALS_01232 [Plasmopara halstedii]|eukprot:XP_024581274.1 hypothetical protein PHALS_01232 [Plasmopara halstedii]